jgi:hypothetical protein
VASSFQRGSKSYISIKSWQRLASGDGLDPMEVFLIIILISWGGVRLIPLGTSATNWLIFYTMELVR